MRVSVCVGVLLLGASAAAEKPPRALAKAPTPVLAGRIVLRLPEGAKLEARGHSIMAADEAAETEARAAVDAEGARFVMMAYDLRELGGPRFETEVQTIAGKEWPGAKVEPVTVAPPLRALGVAPPAPAEKSEANLAYVAFVLQPDGTVLRLLFYVSPPGLKALARWADLGRRTAASALPGTRSLERGAGPRRFRGVGTDKLVVTVPEGFVTSTQEGPDFFVHHLDRLAPMNAPPENCGLYLGGHPGMFHERAQSSTQAPGKLLGSAVTWYGWVDGAHCVEALAPHPLQAPLKVHAFCCAPSAERLTAIRPILDSLTVAK